MTAPSATQHRFDPMGQKHLQSTGLLDGRGLSGRICNPWKGAGSNRAASTQCYFPMLNRILSKPLRTVLRWQVYATVLIATAAGLWAGRHGAVSAILGGIVNQTADVVYALLVSGTGIKTAGQTLRTLLRAGAARILLIVVLLGVVLSAYKGVVHGALFVSFAVSVLVFRMAILVKE